MASCSPTEYRVERDVVIEAPSDVIFQHVNNLKLRETWRPWEKKIQKWRKPMKDQNLGLAPSTCGVEMTALELDLSRFLKVYPENTSKAHFRLRPLGNLLLQSNGL